MTKPESIFGMLSEASASQPANLSILFSSLFEFDSDEAGAAVEDTYCRMSNACTSKFSKINKIMR